MSAYDSEVTQFFWDIAQPFLFRDNIEKSKMFGNPCLRIGKEFVCMPEHRNGGMIVKLPKARVTELIAAEIGKPVAPAGRVFKEWVEISKQDAELWEKLIEESLVFVEA